MGGLWYAGAGWVLHVDIVVDRGSTIEGIVKFLRTSKED
jgi:hypothetical protein